MIRSEGAPAVERYKQFLTAGCSHYPLDALKLAGVDLSEGPYDFAMANIVADILIRMSENVADYLKAGAKLVCSGIIEGRWQDVREAMEAHGLTLCDEGSENDWKVLVFTKN